MSTKSNVAVLGQSSDDHYGKLCHSLLRQAHTLENLEDFGDSVENIFALQVILLDRIPTNCIQFMSEKYKKEFSDIATQFFNDMMRQVTIHHVNEDYPDLVLQILKSLEDYRNK